MSGSVRFGLTAYSPFSRLHPGAQDRREGAVRAERIDDEDINAPPEESESDGDSNGSSPLKRRKIGSTAQPRAPSSATPRPSLGRQTIANKQSPSPESTGATRRKRSKVKYGSQKGNIHAPSSQPASQSKEQSSPASSKGRGRAAFAKTARFNAPRISAPIPSGCFARLSHH